MVTDLLQKVFGGEEFKPEAVRRPNSNTLDDLSWFDNWRHIRLDRAIPFSVDTPGNEIYFSKTSSLSFRDKLVHYLRH